jgi:DNA-binding NtrC family response regulator
MPLYAPDAGSSERQIGAGEIVAASAAMQAVQKTIGVVADNDAPVLIVGEVGTGKNLVARAIHHRGKRSDKPFVAANCASVCGELLESRLFGDVRGAFSESATDCPGWLREADGGTLFLANITNMPLAVQSKLLRVLQDRVVTPLGGKPAAIDVRIIVAAPHGLEPAAGQDYFLEDLLYWQDLVLVHLPPLQERLVDILPLAEHFLTLGATRKRRKHLSVEASKCLLDYDWPGNVRELRDAVERAASVVRQPMLNATAFDFLPGRTEREVDWLAGDLPTAVARLETAMIRQALAACGGKRAEAAQRLNINRQLLYVKMRRYGLDVAETRADVVTNAGSSASDGHVVAAR